MPRSVLFFIWNMSLSLWIESVVYLGSFFFLVLAVRGRRKRSTSHVLTFFFYSLLTVSTLEVINEMVYAETSYLSASWFRFPGFQFPLAIVLGGSLLNVAILGMTLRTTDLIHGESAKTILRAGLPVVLVGLCIPIEILFSSIGFWTWTRGVPDHWEKWLEVYRYYLIQYYAPYAATAAMRLWLERKLRGLKG